MIFKPFFSWQEHVNTLLVQGIYIIKVELSSITSVTLHLSQAFFVLFVLTFLKPPDQNIESKALQLGN